MNNKVKFKKYDSIDTFEYGKIPPQSIEFEEAVIGAILTDSSSIDKIIDFLKPEMFYKQAHQTIYKAILTLYATEKPVDILTVNQQLKKDLQLELVGGTFYLMQISNKISSSANIEYHSRIIHEKYISRELIRTSHETIKSAFEESTDSLNLLQNAIANVNSIEANNLLTSEKIEHKNIEFPIHCLPEFIQSFMVNANQAENFSIDFMAVSFISAFASLAGAKLKVRYKNTWIASPLFWFVIVGSPGSKKSHPVKLMLNPVKKIDKHNREEYDQINEEYLKYKDMDKAEKNGYSIEKPIDTQIIIKNTTIEALFNAHKENPNGLLYYRDEIDSWVSSMNQYRGGKGDDMPNWLSMFDGDDLNINRVSKERLVLDETHVNLIGTTQPSKISSIPSDNGLLHRILFTNSDNNISSLKFTEEISQSEIKEYNSKMQSVYDYYNSQEFEKIYTLDFEAKQQSILIDAYLMEIQHNENETSIMRQYCEKMKTYIPRFEVLLADVESMFNDNIFGLTIKKHHVEWTFDLIKYFVNSARNLFKDQKERAAAKSLTNNFKLKTDKDKAIEMIKNGISITQISNELELSRTTIYNYKKNAII